MLVGAPSGAFLAVTSRVFLFDCLRLLKITSACSGVRVFVSVVGVALVPSARRSVGGVPTTPPLSDAVVGVVTVSPSGPLVWLVCPTLPGIAGVALGTSISPEVPTSGKPLRQPDADSAP